MNVVVIPVVGVNVPLFPVRLHAIIGQVIVLPPVKAS